MPTLSQAEAADVGEAEAEGEEEATPVKMIAESDDSTLHDLKPSNAATHRRRGTPAQLLDEVSTKVLPRPDLNSTPQEPIQPGDYVWVKKFVRKRWNTPRWEGPYQVKAREQWRTLRKRLTACIGPATAEPRRNL
ncbi:hypothetical protein D4764_02G0004140 [Takifugu flavidus]|uniref:Murine leukemia virus integrase C-terminal domain-containing protein n=1 Tax=Takifugu flavidus TaxID=433684 RepID=A0A5C6NJG3_9TELE|nr:hypothetical protein D4764_02G0004140 [Takifugu flavidus]